MVTEGVDMSSASDPPSAIRRRIHNQTLSLEGVMPIALPESVKKVLEDKAYGHVITFNPNGRPQVTMVWMDVEGNEALFNTAEGRKKPQNLQRDPRIIISVQNRTEPQSYLLLNGTATVTETGADAHADKLAKRFLPPTRREAPDRARQG